MPDLHLTLPLTPAQHDALEMAWWTHSDTDLRAHLLALIAEHPTALTDAVAELEAHEGWCPPVCPHCGEAISEVGGEVWRGDVWHRGCLTQHGWEIVKGRAS